MNLLHFAQLRSLMRVPVFSSPLFFLADGVGQCVLLGEEALLRGVKQCHANSASAAKIRKRKLPRIRAPKAGEDGRAANLCDFVVLEFMDGGSLEDRVEDRVRDVVADLVRVALGDRLRREQLPSHLSLPLANRPRLTRARLREGAL